MQNIIYLLIIILLSYYELNAQWDNNIVCPGDSSHCPWLDSLDEKVQLSYKHDQYAYVKYRYRYCNGILEIDVTAVSTIDNAGFLNTFTIEHYEFASLRSAIELGVLTHHAFKFGIDSLDPSFGADSLDPNFLDTDSLYRKRCSDTAFFVNFYSASCGIFLNCTYERADTSRICSPYFTPPYPEIIEDMVKKAVSTKWQNCGYNCCKRTYKICRDLSSVTRDYSVSGNNATEITENYKAKIIRILEVKITSETDCSLQSKYGSKTCYTNCWNTPIP